MEGHIERTIRVNGQLMNLSTPKVMGILNVTPDSFYAGSRKETTSDIAYRVEQIITEGADMIDIGAYSSRPNAEHVSTKEEMARLRKGLEIIREVGRTNGQANVRHRSSSERPLYHDAHARHSPRHAATYTL